MIHPVKGDVTSLTFKTFTGRLKGSLEAKHTVQWFIIDKISLCQSKTVSLVEWSKLQYFVQRKHQYTTSHHVSVVEFMSLCLQDVCTLSEWLKLDHISLKAGISPGEISLLTPPNYQVEGSTLLCL